MHDRNISTEKNLRSACFADQIWYIISQNGNDLKYKYTGR